MLLLFCIFPDCKLVGQNLVRNPSFEDITSCPTGYDQIDKCLYWYSPTTNKSELFSSCATSIVGVPLNDYGYQEALEGNNFADFLAFTQVGLNYFNGRSYIQQVLTEPLIQNQKYYVNFYLNLPDSCAYAISSIGVLFTTDSFFINISENIADYIPQIESSPSQFFSSKDKWMLFSDSLIAGGGEQYITIGNFRNDTNTSNIFLGGPYGTGYFIDMVYVGTENLIVNDNSINYDKHLKKIFPNPTNDNITVQSKGKTCPDLLKIYNVFGQIVCEKLLSKKRENYISLTELEPGIYYLCFYQEGCLIGSEKLIICK